MIQYPLGAGGTVTRVLEAGTGTRHLVFVHGLSTRADRWRLSMETLAVRGFHCVAFDLPGHGLAAKPEDFEYTVPRLGRFVGEVLDALAIDRAALVSTSLGSHIAAHFMVQQPGRVAAHLMVGALGLAPVADATRQAINRSVRDVSQAGIRAKLGNVFADPARFATEALIEEEWRVNSSPGALQALSALGDYVAERLNFDLVGDEVRALLPTIPSMLLWGQQDKVVPLAVGEATRAALGEIPMRIMEGVGHAPYIEAPDAFAAIVAEFLGA